MSLLAHSLLAKVSAILPIFAALQTVPIESDGSISAEEARQGVASDGQFVFAVDNSRIGKYRIADGVRVQQWEGDAVAFPHLNSCTMVKSELVCATSNYPNTPHTSRVEFFDSGRLLHKRSRDLGRTDGSLTAVNWNRGSWWATFAHYDGKGGVQGKDSSQSRLVRMDRNFRAEAEWKFPAEVIDRMRPYSASGFTWLGKHMLAASGHHKPEIYLLSLPAKGTILVLEKIISVETEGQAIDNDPCRPGYIWSISRKDRLVVRTDLSKSLPAKAGQPERRCAIKFSTMR